MAAAEAFIAAAVDAAARAARAAEELEGGSGSGAADAAAVMREAADALAGAAAAALAWAEAAEQARCSRVAPPSAGQPAASSAADRRGSPPRPSRGEGFGESVASGSDAFPALPQAARQPPRGKRGLSKMPDRRAAQASVPAAAEAGAAVAKDARSSSPSKDAETQESAAEMSPASIDAAVCDIAQSSAAAAAAEAAARSRWEASTGHRPPYFVKTPNREGYKSLVTGLPIRWSGKDARIWAEGVLARTAESAAPTRVSVDAGAALLTFSSSIAAEWGKHYLAGHVFGSCASQSAFWTPAEYSAYEDDPRFAGYFAT